MRFYCYRCNQIISVKDALAGSQVTCDHCSRKTPVPHKDDYNRLLPDENTRKKSQKYLKLRESRLVKYMTSHVIFSEVSVFAMSFSMLLLLLVSRALRDDIYHVLSSIVSDIHINSAKQIILIILFVIPTALLIILPPLAGIYLALVHAIGKREKTEFEKTCIFLFAVYFNVLAGAVSGKHLLLEAFTSKWWYLLMILPLWNCLSVLSLLIKLDEKIEEDDLGEMVSDTDAVFPEIIVAVLVCAAVIIITQFGIGLHWSHILSMCVIYATNFCKSWRDTFASDN